MDLPSKKIAQFNAQLVKTGIAGNRPTAAQKMAAFLSGLLPKISICTITEGNPSLFFENITHKQQSVAQREQASPVLD